MMNRKWIGFSVVVAAMAPVMMGAGVAFDQNSAKPEKGDEVAVMETGEGRIVLMFFPEKAPGHVKNFKALAGKGFYDGTRFHRCIANFMIQGGDPQSADMSKSSRWGTGGATDEDGGRQMVKAEFNDLKHERGILSMARAMDPDSASSQFFIMHKKAASLDGQYSAFGKVVEGMDVVDKIVKTGDPRPSANGAVKPEEAVVIKSVKIMKWPLKKEVAR